MYFQLGAIAGAIIGWIHGAPGRGDIRGAVAALPIGGVLLVLAWVVYAQAALIFPALAGLAIGYAAGFMLRRAPKE